MPQISSAGHLQAYFEQSLAYLETLIAHVAIEVHMSTIKASGNG